MVRRFGYSVFEEMLMKNRLSKGIYWLLSIPSDRVLFVIYRLIRMNRYLYLWSIVLRRRIAERSK